MSRDTPGIAWLGLTVVLLLAWGCAAEHQDSVLLRDNVVLVEGGSFRMGTSEDTIPELRTRYGVSFPGSFENEVPEHAVTVGSFRMDAYEVTNERFSEFVTARPEWGPGRIASEMHNGRYLEHWAQGTYPDGTGGLPVVFVTWHAAQYFCEWAGGRLPSEAEWEYAARAGRTSEFPWGEELPSPERANYGASELGGTTPVGSYPPNPLGLYDMAGNVWEWVLDVWEPVHALGARVDQIADAIPAAGAEAVRGRRTIRGGSFGSSVVNLRTRWRDSHDVLSAEEFVGFRCVYPDKG